jgi:hypothetical protein
MPTALEQAGHRCRQECQQEREDMLEGMSSITWTGELQ